MRLLRLKASGCIAGKGGWVNMPSERMRVHRSRAYTPTPTQAGQNPVDVFDIFEAFPKAPACTWCFLLFYQFAGRARKVIACWPAIAQPNIIRRAGEAR